MQISIFYQMLVVAIAATVIVHSSLVSFSRKVTLDDRQVTQGVLGTVEGNTDVCGVSCALDPLCVALSVSPGHGGVCRLYSHVFRGVPASLTFDPGARYFAAPILTLEEFRKQNFVQDGVYDVILPDDSELPVYVDVTSDGVAWLVVMRRQDGSEDFDRLWKDYKEGFGNLTGEFWIGNDLLHTLTAAGLSVLRVDVEDSQNATANSIYGSFRIGDLSTKYKLVIGAFDSAASTAGDALAYHNGMPFSTKDQDSTVECVAGNDGGWWYNGCYQSLLTGPYITPGSLNSGGVIWLQWKDTHESLRRAEMKLRLTPQWRSPSLAGCAPS